ncbi:sodium/hydrogen exchanger 9B2-like [Saccostrea echinata]|uniref:sodium/hydrogen exchanger 9B2-like n=1 Tax=Saccostrea echinata TaxID=191078 RepID=UPI002A7F8B43|nr:sodium/hydrogen exchanger 9B2-like [Saccostrea echinata]
MDNNCNCLTFECKTKNCPDEESKTVFHKILHVLLPNSKTVSDSDCNTSKKIFGGKRVICPPHGNCALYTMFSFICVSTWIILYSVSKEQSSPGGNLFSLFVLFTGAVIGGHIFSLIRLPPLLGMLIVGGLLSNVPGVKVVGLAIDPKWSASLRKIALTVILLRAGLGLDPVALRKLSLTVLRVALVPCLFEVAANAVTANLLLAMPWTWSFMLGFALSAVSPAVVVPSLLNLADSGYGLDKGIPTLVIAAATIDDVFNITGFGVLLGIVFSQGELALTIAKGPLETLLGISYGAVFGVFLWYFPSKDSVNRTFYRAVLLVGFGLVAIFGSPLVQLPGAGPLGCLTVGFVAAFGWRKERNKDENDTVAEVTGVLWMLFQPFLFGLIGAAVKSEQIHDLSSLGLGTAVIAVGQTIRIGAAVLSVLGTEFSTKERIFIAIARFPKATVQAAIGGLALDMALADNNQELIRHGTVVLTTAVLSIIITAPIGALVIALSGPRLLNKLDRQTTDETDAECTDDMENASMLQMTSEPQSTIQIEMS